MSDKWMHNRYADGIWSGEQFDTKEQAIQEGISEYKNTNKGSFYVGRTVDVSMDEYVQIDADEITDHIADNARYIVGEAAEDYLWHVNREHITALEDRLAKVFKEWAAEFGYVGEFFKVEDTEKIEFECEPSVDHDGFETEPLDCGGDCSNCIYRGRH